MSTSYTQGRTQGRTTESWNNDPNTFQNLGGPDAGFHDGLNEQQRGHGGSFFPGNPRSTDSDTHPTHDPTDTSTWSTDPTSHRQGEGEWERDSTDTSGIFGTRIQRGGQPDVDKLWTPSRGENYGSTGTAGNTTDVNTVSASGAQYAGAGPQGGVRQGDNWHNTAQVADTAPVGKPSVSEKLKDNVEKLVNRRH